MSEERGQYRTGTQQTLTPATLLRYTDPDYQAPTAADVRTLKDLSGRTGRELADLVGLKDPRNFRKWTAPDSANQKSQIPYAAWRLLLIELEMLP